MQSNMPFPALSAGSRVGRFSILGPLGAGGMGVVYRARDEKLFRDVAIKVLSHQMFSNGEARERFRTEALALARLSHGRIANVYDFGEENGFDYIVMECVEGESLASKLKAGPLNVTEATSICAQIAEALEAAHARGVIHRDLKPGNVMIDEKGRVKVLDFGLAKLFASQGYDETAAALETQFAGTPLYMSPEQALGKAVDTRTDLWSLGCVYYESLTGMAPFRSDTLLGVLHAIAHDPPTGVGELRAGIPAGAGKIITRALEKVPDQRYQAAAEIVQETSNLLRQLTAPPSPEAHTPSRATRFVGMASAVTLLIAGLIGGFAYRQISHKNWARDEALGQIKALIMARRELAADGLLTKALRYDPSNVKLQKTQEENTVFLSVNTEPTGTEIQIQDYVAPDSEWRRLGKAPFKGVRAPKGYFRWKLVMPQGSEMVIARAMDDSVSFDLMADHSAPEGMVRARDTRWEQFISFVGWLGPYDLPTFYLDKNEVTNLDFQSFVDRGGYSNRQYWTEKFLKDGRELTWDEAMKFFRDTSGRPGPAGWVAGHYPEGKANYPVTGLSWYEASAYAAFVGKQLPVLAQWFYAAEPDAAPWVAQVSNLSKTSLAPVGTYKGVGRFGTYDLAGNAREWIANETGEHEHFILGGSWNSEPYIYSDPEALKPFDRSETNGFRCVKNVQPVPTAAQARIVRSVRDFAKAKPVSDEVFNAYKLLYQYPHSPLNAKNEGVVQETADWREEKISFDAAYHGERMAAYLFLPKNIQPPYQTVLFFPSARVLFQRDSSQLGDTQFFDYVVQSGRAVIYPIYEQTYERRTGPDWATDDATQSGELIVDYYKDAARSLDYLETRPDIDKRKLGYLGVSMGAADGVIAATLLQDRLQTLIFLDGGFFLNSPPKGSDQVDFVARLKKPVLMVNGRYDYTFPVREAQNPFFDMLGTPAAVKRHLILDTPHDVTEQRPQLVKAVLDWLDQYLGRTRDESIPQERGPGLITSTASPNP